MKHPHSLFLKSCPTHTCLFVFALFQFFSLSKTSSTFICFVYLLCPWYLTWFTASFTLSWTIHCFARYSLAFYCRLIIFLVVLSFLLSLHFFFALCSLLLWYYSYCFTHRFHYHDTSFTHKTTWWSNRSFAASTIQTWEDCQRRQPLITSFKRGCQENL